MSIACRLTEKAYDEGHHVYVHLATDTLVESFDQALWQFKPERFIPHQKLMPDEPLVSRVTFSCNLLKLEQPDILINLSNDLHPQHNTFQRILELVPQRTETHKQEARQRYRYYQKAGHHMTTHEI